MLPVASFFFSSMVVCGRGKSLPTPRINAEAISHTNDFRRERVRRNAYKHQLTTNQLAFQGAILTAVLVRDWNG